VIFASNYDIPMGSVQVPGSRWQEPVPVEELEREAEGWSGDAKIIFDEFARNPGFKWAIQALNPPLKSYVRDRVALVGDAVCGASSL
jgi:salicylate hydroxylase